MIVKMKKIWLMVSRREKDSALQALRSLGVLHVKHSQLPQSPDLDAIESELINCDIAIRLLGGSAEAGKAKAADPALIGEILDKADARNLSVSRLEDLEETAEWFTKWGKISRHTLQQLEEAGVSVQFYTADRNAVKKLDPENIIIAGENGGQIRFAHFSAGEEEHEKLPFTEDTMPPVEYSELMREIENERGKLAGFDRSLKEYTKKLKSIASLKAMLEKHNSFNRVASGMKDEEGFSVVQGFIPEDEITPIRKAADDQGWAYLIDETDDPSEVPTLVRRPKWLKMIQPMFEFMGTLPGYAEYDISMWFLMFFSVFFAMIIGDAGYGLVFLVLTLVARWKMKGLPGDPFMLLGVLSITTIVWGLITGTWFGYEAFAKLPFLNRFIIDKIYSYAVENQNFMMYLCFVIGIIHLSIAHMLRGFRVIKSPAALGELGWIAILWVLFFVAGNLVLNKPMPGFTGLLFAGGIVMTLVFSNFQKNILKGVMATLSDLPLSIISSFSDVVSYLRLFAVGYASVTVASAFNGMAAQLGFGSVVSGLITALILFMGHALNIILGVMSVVVHGVRLNMLEFSGHLNMQWAGKPYEPFSDLPFINLPEQIDEG